ncbi:unnamed protein product, partial [Didymodactylos carnosus]
RHELWISIIDHNEDGTLSTTVLHDPVEFKLSDNELTDQDVIHVLSQLNLPFDPVAMIKSIKIDGIEYRENALIYVADHLFRALPQFGEVKYIVNNETDVLFVYNELETLEYSESVRSFAVKRSNNFNYLSYYHLQHAWPLKLVNFRHSLYVPLHPYGHSYSSV